MPPASVCAHLEARARRAAFVRRGAISSAITTTVAAVSHTVGGGPAPAPSIVLGMIVLLVVPSALLLGTPKRGRGISRIALTTLVAQLAFHLAFTVLGAPVEGTPVIGGHQHGAPLDLGGGSVHIESPGMLAAHAAAALATIAILAYGESWIRRGAGWIRHTARVLAGPAPLPHLPRILAPVRTRIRTVAAWTPQVGLRGPPVFS